MNILNYVWLNINLITDDIVGKGRKTDRKPMLISLIPKSRTFAHM